MIGGAIRLYQKNWDNYEYNKFIGSTGIPVWSWISGARAAQMEYEENRRYWSDFAKNTGVNINDWKYPIRMGYYNGVSGMGSSIAGANQGIMRLYDKATYKPPVHYHTHQNYINNYGDYYRYG